MQRWYVVHTKPGKERVAEGNLLRQGFEAYLPRLASRKRHARRTIEVAVPLFPRYLFVALDLAVERWRSVNGTYGVQRLVAFGERPAALPDGVVPDLKAREGADGVIRETAVRRFEKGERVAIAGGALSENDAVFEARDGAGRVTVLLSMLGRQVSVRLSEDRIRAAS